MTTDSDAAYAFYVGKLGLRLKSRDDTALLLQTGGDTIEVVRVPGFAPSAGTVLGWDVQDIEEAVRWLSARGVVLEHYDFISPRQAGIWKAPSGERIAWFKDPDGNVLSISQRGSGY